MAVSPTYPGVYIDELPNPVRTIIGVSTAVAAFVGPAARGPVDEPRHITTWSDFDRIYGGLSAASLMSYAVFHFYQNGGSEAEIVRVAARDASAVIDLGPEGGAVKLQALKAGAAGNDIKARVDYDPADATTSVLPVPDYLAALSGDVKGLRVGLLRSFFLESATPEVRAAVETAAKALEKAGAILDEVALPAVAHVGAASYAVVASEALAYHTGWLKSRPTDYDPEVRKRLQLGAFITGAHYVRGQQVRALVRNEVDAALARRDVLLAPTTPLTAPRLDERQTTLGDGPSEVRGALIRLTRPFNFSGHPACAVPCGFSTGGLPIGMQLVGRPFDEATVLRAADAYQRLTDWHTRRPVLA